MNEKDLEQLITTAEASEILGIKPISFSLWKNGHLPGKGPFELTHAHRIGGAFLWRRSDVEALAAKLVPAYRAGVLRNPTPFPDETAGDE